MEQLGEGMKPGAKAFTISASGQNEVLGDFYIAKPVGYGVYP
jgi:hypothetical protein